MLQEEVKGNRMGNADGYNVKDYREKQITTNHQRHSHRAELWQHPSINLLFMQILFRK